MKSLLVFLVALSLALPTLANDSYFAGVAGSLAPSQSEHPAIRMESEKIILTLRPDNLFDTDANLVLVNDSAQRVTVAMGFPEDNNLVVLKGETLRPQDLGFQKFATSVDGRPMAARRTRVENCNFTWWWGSTVEFAPHETRRIRVRATSRLGAIRLSDSQSGMLTYNFTGGNWKGLVSHSELEVRVPLRGAWQATNLVRWDKTPSLSVEKAPRFVQKKGVATFGYEWTNWQAQGTASVDLMRVMPHNLTYNYGSPAETERFYKWKTNFQIGEALDRADNSLETSGFVRDGVTMMVLTHFVDVADDAGLQPKATWDAKTRTASLQVGAVKASFAPGNRVMTVERNGNKREVRLRAAPVMVRVGREGEKLYVSLVAAARELRFDYELDVARHYVNVSLRK